MRNIPVFTTEFGVASLILKEIPYTQTAYIKILSSLAPVELLEECRSFCCAAGAEKIYAAGDACLDQYPLHTKILRMEAEKAKLPDTGAIARPVLPDNAQQWKDLYNQSMSGVANASFMDDRDVKQMLQQKDGYFVFQEEKPIGIGRVSGDHIHVVASLVRGCGRNTTLALVPYVTGDTVCLEVASNNERAIKLYKSLGFCQTSEISAWYKIL